MQNSLLARVGEAVWGWPMMALFLGTGIWYMLRLRGLPLRRLGQALRAIFRGGESADGISPYAALCTALAATIGTGNIVGVATALAAGGPGALLWMMVAALFGMPRAILRCATAGGRAGNGSAGHSATSSRGWAGAGSP